MVLEPVGVSHQTREGEQVRTFKVADKTGSINLCIFGEMGGYLKPGDIIRVRGYASLFKGSLTAYVGKTGEIRRVGEFCLPISEVPNMSEMNLFHRFRSTFKARDRREQLRPTAATSTNNTVRT